MSVKFDHTGLEVAIVGIGCRVPGAHGPKEFWQRIAENYHSNRSLTPEELTEKNVNSTQLEDPRFVNSVSVLENKDKFDNGFFNYTPAEAAQLNPEHRIFHECVWEALEDAGHYPESFEGQIGLYASGGLDFNWKLYSKFANQKHEINDFYLERISSKDYLSSLIAYKLNLTGAAYTVHTACSSSLVALHNACRGLLLGEVKMALAGGVSINTPKQRGYIHDEGMILSSDGSCRPFDKNSDGTFNSEGAGVVVLKRLKDAIANGDHIYATIKGSAVNNDGKRKVGYTAPSVEGQAECIRMAQKFAKVTPTSIGYIETHGTATKLGDPIELEALNMAFNNERPTRCAIGSVKSNIGHLNTAAGIAGLIKTALALKNKQLPASNNYEAPNPNVNFEEGPFFVNNSLQPWNRNEDSPLRAGVSSFGIGGTNAHVILEEAPERDQQPAVKETGVLTISAKTENSISRYIDKLERFVQETEDLNLENLAYSLNEGRKPFGYRKYVVYSGKNDLLQKLKDEVRMQQSVAAKDKLTINFVFPGAGSQYVNMGRDLYTSSPVFQAEMNRGFQRLEELTGIDYKSIVFSDKTGDLRINEMLHTQPMIFVFEHAMAKLLMSFGIEPNCMIGHSIGEYAAACISGVFSYEDALQLVVKRGQLMHSLSGGGMLSVAATEEEIQKYIIEGIDIAAVNGPDQIVLSGDVLAIDKLTGILEDADEQFVRLHADQAGHSYMMESIMEEYSAALDKVVMNEAEIPFVSNVTGKLITSAEAMSKDYWLTHMRQTVRFHDGIQTMLKGQRGSVFLEVGPGHAMSGLIKQFGFTGETPTILNTVSSIKEEQNDHTYFLECLGKLWTNGVRVNFTPLFGEAPARIPAPTYAFQQNEFPCEVDLFEEEEFWEQLNVSPESDGGDELKDWLYYPYWSNRNISVREHSTEKERTFLVFTGNDTFSAGIGEGLRSRSEHVVTIEFGERFHDHGNSRYSFNPSRTEDLETLASELKKTGRVFSDIAYLWGISEFEQEFEVNPDNPVMKAVYFSLTRIFKGLASIPTSDDLKISVITKNAHRVIGSEEVQLPHALTLGLVHVIPQEYQVPCVNIDISTTDNSTISRVLDLLYREDPTDRVVAVRNGMDWMRDFQRNDEATSTTESALKENGRYLVTGGLGKVGGAIVGQLIDKYDAEVILLGRRQLPENFDAEKEQHEEWLNRLKAFQQKSDKVQYIQSDVTDLVGLKGVMDTVFEQNETLDGVIHAAGNLNFEDFEFIHDTTVQKTMGVLSAKVEGIENLYAVLKDNQPGFVWITSSLATVIAGLSFGAYAAANLYMEHFLQKNIHELPNWKCIGLSEMVFEEDRIKEEQPGDRRALKPDEIFELFEWSASKNNTPIIYETVLPLEKRIERAFSPQTENTEETTEAKEADFKVSRPNLTNEYIAPETETEKTLIALVEEFFGIEGIGIMDGFFELGGDSLKAMVLLKRIKRDFEINIPLKEFFTLTSMKEIAAEIDTRKWITTDVKMKNEITI